MSSTDPSVHPELSAEGLAQLGPQNLCDRESIHLSGAIQPHGFLLVVDPVSLIVTAASENLPAVSGRNRDPLGLALGDVLTPEVAREVLVLTPTSNPHDLLPMRVQLPLEGSSDETAYEMVAHVRGFGLVLEFEEAEAIDGAESARFFQRQRDAMKSLLNLDKVEELCARTVQEVRNLTGFDRVMIYRFEPDAHGHVLAEECRDSDEPFLGLHYPATDIPRQARSLYLRNWIRVIADVGYDPVSILAGAGGEPERQLDLSMSVLRSVSPMHLQYLQNMGVAATMTISLIVDNELWGLIACHHSSPKRVDHVQRLACEALGQLVSVRLRAAQSSENGDEQRELGRMSAQVVTAMAAGENAAVGASAVADSLLGMARADGVIVEIDGTRVMAGSVPGPEVLELLVPHLAELAGGGPAPTAAEVLPDLPGLADHLDSARANGSLFLPLPGRAEGFVLWLRGERAQTVRWAGQPDCKSDADLAGEPAALTPRKSFAEWLEDVRGRSLPWRSGEIAAATELGQAMPEVLLHRAQNRLVKLALHDPLTGLPNRVLLHDRLSELLRSSTGDGAGEGLQLGVLFLDIDGFKTVNDTRGHLVGDELLTLVARRITAVIRPQDTVARMGGDEFVVLLPVADAGEASVIGQRIVEDFRRSFVIGGQVVRSLTLSVGVSVVTAGTEPGEALRQADAAMYHSKRSGRNRVSIYDQEVGTATSRQQLAHEELRDAIAGGEIRVYYQPILELGADGSQVLDGFEAMARWHHPIRGVVGPNEFIELAEETGLIDTLGASVTAQALHQLQSWPDARLKMSVNVSARELTRPGFVTDVLAQLVEFGIRPERLCLEVTESQMMEQPQLVLTALSDLAAADVRIAIDDFGTGYSSLAYVRNLPASELKIDRSFVAGLPEDPKDVAVVAATIRLAHSLGMRTVAEGVETIQQLEQLRELGSDFAQGFLLGVPLPAEALQLSDWA